MACAISAKAQEMAISLPAVAELPEARLDEASSQTRAELDRFTALLANEQWEEAVSTLRQVMEQWGEQMLALNAPEGQGYVRYVSVRDHCHWRLSSLEGRERQVLERYRRRVDPLVQTWYEDALRTRNEDLMRRIANDYFASTYGDNALYVLGEMALERGDHTGARWYWERVAPALRCPASLPVPGAQSGQPLWLALRHTAWDCQGAELRATLEDSRVSPSWLAYPDTDIRLADLRARLVLVSVLEGSPQRAQFELDLLRHLHPDAEGSMGGRKVVFTQALEQLLDQSRQWPVQTSAADWTTFARRPTRDALVPDTVAIRDQPVWTVNLEALFGSRPVSGPANTQTVGRPPLTGTTVAAPDVCWYHPAVVGDVMLINNDQRVYTVDIDTGQAEEMYPRGIDMPPAASHRAPRVGVPHFTMTVHDHGLLARMGWPVTTSLPHEPAPAEQGFVLGWDLRTKKLMMDKIRPDGPKWALDGTPLADQSHLYVAMRYSDIHPQACVACWDLPTQRLRWRTRICSADTWAGALAEEVTHNLLTRDHGVIYFNTNLGAVAAVSAHDGRICWITRYPRASPSGPVQQHRLHRRVGELTPCVFHKGTLLVAPADSDQVFALDAASGQLIWHTALGEDSLQCVHLLGVADDHLIAGGRRLWWLDLTTGQLSRDVAVNPFPDPDNSPLEGFGRGVVTGDCIYWPARAGSGEIHVIDSHTGTPVRQPIPLELPPGREANLIAAQGYLFVTTSSRIYAFHK